MHLPNYSLQWYDRFLLTLRQLNYAQLTDVITNSYDNELGFKSVLNSAESELADLGISSSSTTSKQQREDDNKPDCPTAILFDMETTNQILQRMASEESSGTLQLRKYQEELLTKALRGDNVIISAPTGSGKTVLCIPLIERALRVEPNKKAVIAFLNIIQTNDVIVCTPVKFSNMLNQPDLLRSTPVGIKDFSLMLFDECHHTNKEHPYSDIMCAYRDIKFGNDAGSAAGLPQIVGLTASTGSGKAQETLDAYEYVLNICARMDADHLCHVRENRKELKEMVPNPIDLVVYVSPQHDTHPFAVAIGAVMTAIERLMFPILDAYPKTSNFGVPRDIPRHSAKYLSVVVGQLKINASRFLKNDENRDVQLYLLHLENCNIALMLNAHVPTKQALSYLSKFVETEKQRQSFPTLQWILALYTKCMPNLALPHSQRLAPLPAKLREILCTAYFASSDSGSSSSSSPSANARTMIFVQTRQLTLSLEEFINSDPQLSKLGVRRLVSQNVPNSQGGMAGKSDQRSAMESFRSGDARILVSTTAGEEGLDIPLCNLVIKYNHVTNETAMIQKRSRGRAPNSKSILLTHELDVKKKEDTNAEREKMMAAAITKIVDEGPQKFRMEMDTRQQRVYEDQVLMSKNKKKEPDAPSTLRMKKLTIVCKHCENFLATSDDLRLASQTTHVIVNPNIVHRVRASKPSTGDGTSLETLDLRCGKCRSIVGNTARNSGVKFPVLKVKELKFVEANGSMVHTCKQWKTLYEKKVLKVLPLSNEDIREMNPVARQFDLSARSAN